ncbi:hypothetical protein [Azotobacter vinelandii]
MIDLRTLSNQAALRELTRYLVSRRVSDPRHELQPSTHRLIARVCSSIDRGDDLVALEVTLRQCLIAVNVMQARARQPAAVESLS